MAGVASLDILNQDGAVGIALQNNKIITRL